MGHLRLEITVRTKALASRGWHDVGWGRAEQLQTVCAWHQAGLTVITQDKNISMRPRDNT